MGLKQSTSSRAVWTVALSYWHNRSPLMGSAATSKIASIAWCHIEFMVTVQLPSSKNYGPVIPKVGIPHQILTFEQCKVS